VGEQVHVMHGPWQVVIRGLGAYVGRRVVSRWEVYRSWSQVTRVEQGELGGADSAAGVGSSERFLGASMGQSELRFRGASEVFFLGASQVRFGGASEYAYSGASEWLMRGASERRLGGSSEYAYRGASERRLGGSSEYGYSGASERRLGGASEGRLLGGSEGRLGGASERHASDQGASTPYDSSSVSWATIAVPLADDDDIPWHGGESGTSSGRK
jgi:hypothetical protein